MAQKDPALWPFATNVLREGNSATATDSLPASYHYHGASGKRIVENPEDGVSVFAERELSLGRLSEMLNHLWFAGAKRPAAQLHFQIAMGREIIVVDRMDLHLIWDNGGRIFLKPIPRFLLDPAFWQRNLNDPTNACTCQDSLASSSRRNAQKVALGFLYTYACLISSENDFFFANEKRLLPRKTDDTIIKWADWKKLVREILAIHKPDKVHPRFLHAELRLSRLNTINRFTRLPPFEPYLRDWNTYGGFFHDNLTWIATATVFVALVLTAIQVGLETEQLQGNANFQHASYGFVVFAILGPLCAIGLVVIGAAINLVKDLPRLFTDKRAKLHGAPSAV